MSPSTGTFSRVVVYCVAHQAADDDRLLIGDDQRRVGRALGDRNRAELADGAPGALDLLLDLEAHLVRLVDVGRDLDLVADVLARRAEAAEKPPKQRARATRWRRRAARPWRGRPCPPPTLVCSGMFSPMLISAATLSVAMMCGVASTFVLPLVGERVQHDAERGNARRRCRAGLRCPADPAPRMPAAKPCEQVRIERQRDRVARP